MGGQSQCLQYRPTRRRLGWAWAPERRPLRTNQEENWSQWLAHLLNSAPEHFYSTLLVEPPASVPRRVRCEVGYGSDSEHDRRADIVLEFPIQGVSIEVKIDDEGYSKTAETAALIENRAPSLEWSHYLLLPRYKRERLSPRSVRRSAKLTSSQ